MAPAPSRSNRGLRRTTCSVGSDSEPAGWSIPIWGSLTGNPEPPDSVGFTPADVSSVRAPHEGTATPVTAAPNRLVAAFAAGQSPRSRPHAETLHMRHVHAPPSLAATTLARIRPDRSTSLRLSVADSPAVSASMAPRRAVVIWSASRPTRGRRIMSRPEELPAWLKFLPLGYPSANMVVATEGHRVLFDAGFGSDVVRTVDALSEVGVPPSSVDLVVNSHWHSDHVGGNSRLQSDYGLPIAASRADAEVVNSIRPDACLAEWLDQPVEQYRIDRPLDPGQTLTAGPVEWKVMATPCHTPSHLSFYQPEEELLVVGDAVHADDIGWINLALDGPLALDVALATIEQLAALSVRLALPGHGPAMTDPPEAFATAHHRYEKMRADPQRAAWHACKRIFAFALIIHDGIPLDTLLAYLTSRSWLVDRAASVFDMSAEALADDLLVEMRRTGAVAERDGRLICLTPHHHPPAE